MESHSDCFVIKQNVFEWLGEEIVIKMHLENNICKPIVVLRRMGGGGHVRDDRPSESAAVKRLRLQEKHTKITRQQHCHKIQGLVLSL